MPAIASKTPSPGVAVLEVEGLAHWNELDRGKGFEVPDQAIGQSALDISSTRWKISTTLL
jgi:hypothetical protein